MALKATVALLLLLGLALAGCSDADKDPEPSSSSSSSTTAAARPNAAPDADLTASVNGTLATFHLNATDANNDTLSWSLAFGDGAAENGTGLPANVTHEYTPGNYTANLTVSDGRANATTQVNVTIATPGPGVPAVGQAATMAWDIGVTDQQSATQGPSYLDCVDGPNKTFNYDSFVLDTATIGQPFRATITDLTGSIQSWTLYFNLEDCSDYSGTFSADGAGEITGIVPDGSGTFALAMATGGFLLEVQYTSGNQMVPAA